MSLSVSVVLGMYNASEYLDECLQSLLDQTLKDIEIICVDDASTDQTVSILEGFARKDSRVKILCQEENKGVGPARNRGIAIARGRYLSILDADDFFEPRMLEEAYKQAEVDRADICIFGTQYYDHQTKKTSPAEWMLNKEMMPKYRPFAWKDNAAYLFEFTSGSAWNKLFRKDFIDSHDISFPPLRNSQDMCFTMMALAMAERITWVDEVFVNYRTNMSTSLTSSSRPKYPLCFYEGLLLVKERLMKEERFKTLEQSFVNKSIDVAVWTRSKLNEETGKIWEEALTAKGGWKALGIEGRPSDYFYNRYAYSEYRKNALPFKRETIVLAILENDSNVDRTVASLLTQTHKELEIVCVYNREDIAHKEMIEGFASKDARIFPVSSSSTKRPSMYNEAVETSFGEHIFYANPSTIYPHNLVEEMLDALKDADVDAIKASDGLGNSAHLIKRVLLLENRLFLLDVPSDGLSLTFYFAKHLGIGLWAEKKVSFYDNRSEQDRENATRLYYQDFLKICRCPVNLLLQLYDWTLPEGKEKLIAPVLFSYIKENLSVSVNQDNKLAEEMNYKLKSLYRPYWIKRLRYSLLSSLTRRQRREKYREKRRRASFVLHVIQQLRQAKLS